MALAIKSIETPSDVPQSPKRLAIIDAAAKLFLSQGYGPVSVDAIAAEAKVSKRTVYSHFENKESLFAGVMYGACERGGGQEICPLSNEDLVRYMPMEDILQKTGEQVLGIITSSDAIDIFRVAVGEAGRFPELGQNFFQFGPASILKMLETFFTEKAESGELSIENPAQAANYFIALMVFPIQMKLALGVRDSVPEKELQQIVADALKAFLKIYTP